MNFLLTASNTDYCPNLYVEVFATICKAKLHYGTLLIALHIPGLLCCQVTTHEPIVLSGLGESFELRK